LSKVFVFWAPKMGEGEMKAYPQFRPPPSVEVIAAAPAVQNNHETNKLAMNPHHN
jgi:hypothetical protein